MTEAMRSETQPRIGIQPTPGVAIDIPNGAHPITFSEASKSHWNTIATNITTGRAIELSSVAQTPKLADTFTPLFDQGSFMDRVGSVARRFAKPALATGGATAAIAGAAIVVDLDGNYVNAQEPSAVPSAEPSLLPGESPTPTDPVTGLPCIPENPNGSPEPSKAPLPSLPPDIGVITGEALAQTGGDVFVSAEAQTAPSAVPSTAPELSPAPSITPAPETAVNCGPKLEKDYLVSKVPQKEELVKFSFMDEAVEAPISMGELKGIINAFYAKYPEALKYVDEYGSKLTTKTRNKILKQCEKGYPGDPVNEVQQSRANSCAGLIRDFHDIAIVNKSQGMMDLAQSVYWYALASLKTPDPVYAMSQFLMGINIKKEVTQG